MFTGIIEAVGRITSAVSGKLVIEVSPLLTGMELGESIAVNGTCLTVTHFTTASFSVEVTPETVKRSNLSLLSAGDGVNLEWPLTLGGRLGGHLVQGHVDGTGRVASVTWDKGTMMIRLEAVPQVMHYVVEKGFIAVDGVSLTVVDCDTRSFRVSVIDYTRKHTILGSRQVGDLVNLEIDIVAKYVEQLSQARSDGITMDLLQEHGFLVG